MEDRTISIKKSKESLMIETFSYLRNAFPSIEDSFMIALARAYKEHNYTDSEIIYSLKHIIYNFEYSKPSIAEFLKHGKKSKLVV